MNNFKKIFPFIIPYKKYAYLNIFFNVLYALFSTLSFIALIPVLKVIFNDKKEIFQKPVYEGIIKIDDYVGDYLAYEMNRITNGDNSKALLFTICLIVVMFLLKNLYWVEKGRLGLRINLKVLRENVSEVGEALPIHATFNKPTLFLRGENSNYITKNEEGLIAEHFPNAKIVTVKNAGHWLHAENPTQFYTEVVTFLN